MKKGYLANGLKFDFQAKTDDKGHVRWQKRSEGGCLLSCHLVAGQGNIFQDRK